MRVYASVLLLPPPPRDSVFLPATPFSFAGRNILIAVTSGARQAGSPADDAKPLLLFLERGFHRDPRNGTCKQIRYVRHFSALRNALVDTFDSEYQVKVYSPRASISTAVQLFPDANVIVGVYGG